MSEALELAVTRGSSEEGFRAHSYRDTRGFLTIGFGFNVDAGISRAAATALLRAQMAETEAQLAGLDWFAAMSPARQSVFIDMGFNQGMHSLLGFTKTIELCKENQWEAAAAELLRSKAAQEDPNRYSNLARILENGL